jgi:hypothetical protein
MSVSTSQLKATSSQIPEITCPQCGQQMRLATVEPEGADNHDSLSFDCECGFEYRLTENALLPPDRANPEK